MNREPITWQEFDTLAGDLKGRFYLHGYCAARWEGHFDYFGKIDDPEMEEAYLMGRADGKGDRVRDFTERMKRVVGIDIGANL